MTSDGEPAATDSDRLYRELIDGTDDLIVRVDTQARITFVNATAESVFGVPPEVCIGLSAFAFVHPDDREATKEAFQSWLVEKRTSVTYENRQVSRDGSIRRMLWTINPSLDESGEVVSFNAIARDITDLRQAEAALRGFAADHRTFVDSSPFGIHLYRLESDGRLVFTGANPAANSILGVDHAQFVGKTIEKAFPPLAQTEIPAQYRQVCATGRPWRTERVEYEDEAISGAYEVFAFRTSSGRMAAQFLDITEKKRSEELLRRRYEFERVITEISTRMISLATDQIDGEIKRVLEEICRYSHAEAGYVFLRTPDGSAVKLTHEWHSDLVDYSQFETDYLDLTDFPWTTERLFVLKEPVVVRWVEDLPDEAEREKRLNLEAGVKAYVSVPLTFEGEAIGILGFDAVEGPRDWDPTEVNLLQIVGQTITNGLQRMLSEVRLRESEEEYRHLFDNAMVAIFRTRPEDGKVMTINRVGAQIAGYDTAEDLLADGVSLAEFYPPEARAEVMRQLAENGEISDFETPISSPKGLGRHFSIWARLHKEQGYIEGVAVEITARKQAEAELSKLNTELERRVKERTAELEATNKELESFAYSVSHDLRAPLRAIDGFSVALLEDCMDQLNESGQDSLRRIRTGATRMAEMLDGILDMSRATRSEIRLSRVDLSTTAAAVTDELRTSDPERLVDVVVAPDLFTHGDPAMLRLVLQNLLSNAWKFTSGRDRARIEFFEEKATTGDQSIDSQRVFCVRDNGAGFDMRYADGLFRPFRRLHGTDEFPGSGVGLATVQRIVHRHGGRVWSDAEIDRGASFFFSLPTETGSRERETS